MAKKVTKVTAEVQRICKEQGVDRLYCNTRGEYFTNYSYAVASEGGDKKKVTTYTYDALDEEEEETGKALKENAGKKAAKEETVKADGKAVKAEEKPEKSEGDE